jgi:tripartite-type tricarboxylate transporter receptor subunit TctC
MLIFDRRFIQNTAILFDAPIRPIQLAMLTAIGLAVASGACAQTPQPAYPSKPIRYIVPFPPGGVTDILARIVGQRLGDAWGQQVIIDNRSGATGAIGSELVAKAPPDGYTMLGGTIATHAISSSLNSKLAYHPLKDFTPVTLLATLPNVLIVHPAMPVRSVKQFVALAKSRPDDMRFSSGGAGTSQHLSGELFNMLMGTRMVHVPYKGGHLAMSDIVGGQIDFSFENAPNCMPYIKGGRLRALGVTTAQRSATLPDLPPIAEVIPGFDVASWQGLFLPAATPPAIVNKLNAEVRRILALPEVRERIASTGADASSNTPEAFVEYIRSELVKWDNVVKVSGAKLD